MADDTFDRLGRIWRRTWHVREGEHPNGGRYLWCTDDGCSAWRDGRHYHAAREGRRLATAHTTLLAAMDAVSLAREVR